MLPHWPLSEHGQRRELMLYNAGGQTIPAYGACEIADSDRPDAGGAVTPGGGRTKYQVMRPTENSLDPSRVLFNGPQPIPPGGEGPGYGDFPTYALYDGGSAMQVGDQWGTVASSFLLRKGHLGFTVCGDIDEGAMLVTRAGMNRIHLARTVADENGKYPRRNANTFHFKFIDGTFPEIAGYRTPAYSEHEEGGICHNIDGGYIPKGKIIFVVWEDGRWWTWQAGVPEGSSSSSISESSYSSSESYSESSGSEPSVSYSEPSSSSSPSESSSSISESVSSSGSSSSDAPLVITLYKPTWDEETCTLTIETGELTLPPGATFTGYS